MKKQQWQQKCKKSLWKLVVVQRFWKKCFMAWKRRWDLDPRLQPLLEWARDVSWEVTAVMGAWEPEMAPMGAQTAIIIITSPQKVSSWIVSLAEE